MKWSKKKGFTSGRSQLTLAAMEGRLDEYSAAYLLDRKAETWNYRNLCERCAANSLSHEFASDIPGFISLMEDVIDRARGRVKKAFRKSFSKVGWRLAPHGWEKTIKSFAPTDPQL